MNFTFNKIYRLLLEWRKARRGASSATKICIISFHSGAKHTHASSIFGIAYTFPGLDCVSGIECGARWTQSDAKQCHKIIFHPKNKLLCVSAKVSSVRTKANMVHCLLHTHTKHIRKQREKSLAVKKETRIEMTLLWIRNERRPIYWRAPPAWH